MAQDREWRTIVETDGEGTTVRGGILDIALAMTACAVELRDRGYDMEPVLRAIMLIPGIGRYSVGDEIDS